MNTLSLRNIRSLHFSAALILSLLLSFTGGPAFAQQAGLRGTITGSGDNVTLIGVGVLLVNQADTNQRQATTTNLEGAFQFRNIADGNYILKVFYVGYERLSRPVTVRGNLDLGKIRLKEQGTRLKEVQIEQTEVRATQKNDTTEYNAKAFKTNVDANAQDLVTKMPGITVENGAVKAQGEAVQKVLIDGKEFFGDDAAIALRNLPAEVVDRIQVFDRLSDQAQFTGFNDGNTQKTMNIVTKSGRSSGQFGRISAGYGTDDRYAAGGNVNFFNGKRRITLIGLSNNINQQNFSSQDLLGLQSSGGGRGGPGGWGGPGGGGRGMGGPGWGGSSNNFIVGQQGGINTTHSAGMNYSDSWGKKVNVTGSYFFNDAINSTVSDVNRNYFLGGGVTQLYNQHRSSGTDNMNHRFNMRLEYNPDTFNSFIFSPRFSTQDNLDTSTLTGFNSIGDSLLNKALSNTRSNNSGYSFSNNMMWRHKFAKPGRTISLNVSSDLNDKTGQSDLYSANHYYTPADSVAAFDQRTTISSNSYNVSPSLNYTEPMGSKAQLMFSYNPTYAASKSNRETNLKDSAINEYTRLNTVLSSRFENHTITHKGGLSYRYSTDRVNYMIGLNYQWLNLEGKQTFPYEFHIDRPFNNVLPTAMMHYKFSKQSNVRMFYRTSTNVPSISQLQTVVDNSNPLLLSTGNSSLNQEYAHVFVTRYGWTNTDKGRTFFAVMNVSYTDDYIGNSVTIAKSAMVVDGIALSRGVQLTRPVNMDGNWSTSTFLTYGLPVKMIKSNLNINLGGNYNRTPGLIDGNLNAANTYGVNSGFVVGSNISENVDFTVSYSANYNIVKNTIQRQQNSNYFYQVSSFKLNLQPWKGLVLASDMSHTYYTGLGSYDINFLLWNAGVGYKFMKNRAAEVRLNVFDLLGQNNSVSRTIAGTYVEDTKTEVLRRYFMVVFTYNIRNFKSAPGAPDKQPR